VTDQLETARLVLEPLLPEHADKLYPSLREPDLYEFLDDEPPVTASVLEERYRRWSKGRSADGREIWLNWAARVRGTDEYVGWFQSTVVGDEAQIAYLVFVPYQRQGYAREASEAVIHHLTADLHVKVIRATADAKNAASIALAKSLGLRETGSVEDGDVTLEALS